MQTHRAVVGRWVVGVIFLGLVDCSGRQPTLVTGGNSSGGNSSTGGTTNQGSTDAIAIPHFDWVGIVGTGQSLAVGQPPARSLTQPYNNLMLSLEGVTVPANSNAGDPWDTSSSAFKMVPLVEPMRSLLHASGCCSYPDNLFGETPHAALGNEITRFVKAASAGADYITVHTAVGEAGRGISVINKQTGSTTGDYGRAYAATLFEVGVITRLAKAANKTYGVGMLMMTHGEADTFNTAYKDQLIQLMVDTNIDISAITGQTYKIPMYLSQQNTFPVPGTGEARSISSNAQWQMGVEHKGDFVCTGPKYQYQGHDPGQLDGVHLSAVGYQMLGEKTAQVYYERAVLGHDWQPLQPTHVERSGRVVTVHFNVPVPPLNWDTTFASPVITEWANGKGFELRVKNSDALQDLADTTSNIIIESVAISGDSVQVTASSDLPTNNLVVGYAFTSQGQQLADHSGASRWGQLRDSDTFTGGTTSLPNPNYCVGFEIPVP